MAMFDFGRSANRMRAQLDAIRNNFAVIEFLPDGTIIDANETFLRTMGYSLSDLTGKKHSQLVANDYAMSAEYRNLWEELRRGKGRSGRFHRKTASGSDVYLQASYSPVFNRAGHVEGVIKIALDVTVEVKQAEKVQSILDMLDQMPVNIMTCDPETYIIDYANKTSIETLRRLQQYIPIRADALVGSSIDVFHKVPQHQRRMVGNHANLPHRAQIKVGPETLDLRVSIAAGKPLLVWSIITDRVEISAHVGDAVGNMAQVSERLTGAARQLVSAANETGAMAQAVAAAAEEQTAAIGEVAERTSATADRARDMEGSARSAQSQIADLSKAVGGIGDVLNLIEGIAAQTKLLALNATIEAARAGTAGRGFAVVASEVKALAEQTEKATTDIGKKISQVQAGTNQTISVVTDVLEGIRQVGELTAAVAAATEEQRGVAAEVSNTIGRVARSAQETGRAAEDISGIATLSMSTAKDLGDRVKAFTDRRD
jgi:methyl-accepting chemotaxis protein